MRSCPGRKGRPAAQEDEEEDEGHDSTTKHIRVPSPPPEVVEYEVKRVDFSKVLPVETIAEVCRSFLRPVFLVCSPFVSPRLQIFSYLQPKTLYRLAFLNRSFHTMLSSPGFRSTWREIFTWHNPRMDWMDEVFFGFDNEEQPEKKKAKPRARDKMPSLGGKEVDPYRLAILLYETTCEASTDSLHLSTRSHRIARAVLRQGRSQERRCLSFAARLLRLSAQQHRPIARPRKEQEVRRAAPCDHARHLDDAL